MIADDGVVVSLNYDFRKISFAVLRKKREIPEDRSLDQFPPSQKRVCFLPE